MKNKRTILDFIILMTTMDKKNLEFIERYRSRYYKDYDKNTYNFDMLKTQALINHVITHTAQELIWVSDDDDLIEREKMYKSIYKSMWWFNMLFLNYSPKIILS